jgi:hypothetical protein
MSAEHLAARLEVLGDRFCTFGTGSSVWMTLLFHTFSISQRFFSRISERRLWVTGRQFTPVSSTGGLLVFTGHTVLILANFGTRPIAEVSSGPFARALGFIIKNFAADRIDDNRVALHRKPFVKRTEISLLGPE